jgi:PAS domain S-box-containing protein
MRTRSAFRPFATRGRHTISAILLTFALVSTLSVGLSLRATTRSQHRASVVEVAARQRTLAQRYVAEVLLRLQGADADPDSIATVLARSASALINGGVAPGLEGDDDETTISAATEPSVRAQLEQERRLIADLTATGRAILAHRAVATVPLTAHESISVADPITRLRVLAAMTSNVSLNAARTFAVATDRNINNLIVIQVLLGAGGLLTSLMLGWALIVTTRRQTAHFRSLVNSSTDLVLVLGASGCRFVSHSVTNILGRPETDVVGHGFLRLVHRDDQALVLATCTEGGAHEVMFRMRNDVDEWRNLEALVTDLREDRHIRGVVLNARDVTDRVRLERQMADLLQKERETVRELREANLIKDQFVAVASHELRTPVTAIVGSLITAQTSAVQQDTATQAELLGRALRQAKRLAQLTQNLLTASAVDRGKSDLSLSSFPFELVVRDALEALGNAGRFSVELPRDLPQLTSDRTALQRILVNLLDNAAKFTPDTRTVEVRARAADNSLAFWVRDYGIGIPESDVARIFDRYYQVDSSSTRRYGGMGLGLSVVVDLLKELGGTIGVRSWPGKGSIFTVSIPLVHPIASPPESEPTRPERAEQPDEPVSVRRGNVA